MAKFTELRKNLITETKKAVASSITSETLIIQAITTLDQLEQESNRLVKKACEWYGLVSPEEEHLLSDSEELMTKAQEKLRSEIEKGEEGDSTDSMGGELDSTDKRVLSGYIELVQKAFEEKTSLTTYVDTKMKLLCPNVTLLATSRIGAQLLSHAGSLRRLASIPSSTLQLYGAETALFRHLKDKHHKAPKYGVLFNHPLVQKVSVKDRGKAARALADKISICAKIDYFKGEEKANEYRKLLAQRFVKWWE